MIICSSILSIRLLSLDCLAIITPVMKVASKSIENANLVQSRLIFLEIIGILDNLTPFFNNLKVGTGSQQSTRCLYQLGVGP